jgi:hypothetical protein
MIEAKSTMDSKGKPAAMLAFCLNGYTRVRVLVLRRPDAQAEQLVEQLTVRLTEAAVRPPVFEQIVRGVQDATEYTGEGDGGRRCVLVRRTTVADVSGPDAQDRIPEIIASRLAEDYGVGRGHGICSCLMVPIPFFASLTRG